MACVPVRAQEIDRADQRADDQPSRQGVVPEKKLLHPTRQAFPITAVQEIAFRVVVGIGQTAVEVVRQVGVAKPAQDGIMQRGLMIRHLVMPNDVAGSEKVMEWIAGNLPKDTYVNIMAQYNPVYKAYDYPELSRRIWRSEYQKVVAKAEDLGLTNLDVEGYDWLQRKGS